MERALAEAHLADRDVLIKERKVPSFSLTSALNGVRSFARYNRCIVSR